MVSKVGYSRIIVSDLKRSVEFYRDILGVPLKFETDGWAEFATLGTRLALKAGAPPIAAIPEKNADGKPIAGRVGIAFEVKNLDQLYRDLSAKGVTFTQAPTEEGHAGRTATLLDPDGLEIALGESHH
ncbi:MAG TPA: VOC family protein [Candidatus Polarisedimenticolia bacterium]|jgi:lactoylglutathione lyase|nr:VOC family protein [Candidatus Polarisedimenticolia bacterium]